MFTFCTAHILLAVTVTACHSYALCGQLPYALLVLNKQSVVCSFADSWLTHSPTFSSTRPLISCCYTPDLYTCTSCCLQVACSSHQVFVKQHTGALEACSCVTHIPIHNDWWVRLLQISNNPFMLIFGGIQILLSQIPDIDKLWLLSVLSATMSISYAIICVALSIGKTTGELNRCKF